MSSARTEELERLRALRPDTLRIRLIALSMQKLKDLANRLGATRITQNKLLMHDHGALRASLIEWITHGAHICIQTHLREKHASE